MTEKSWSEILSEHSPELAALLQEDSRFMAAESALSQVSLHIIGYSMKQCLIDNDPAMSREDVIDQAIGIFLKYSARLR